MEVKIHPLAEIISRKLFAITSVPAKGQHAMVNRAIKAAVVYHDQRVAKLESRLTGATEILEVLADMHRMYKAAIPDYANVPDSKHIHDCLTHGHIRKAAAILEVNDE